MPYSSVLYSSALLRQEVGSGMPYEYSSVPYRLPTSHTIPYRLLTKSVEELAKHDVIGYALEPRPHPSPHPIPSPSPSPTPALAPALTLAVTLGLPARAPAP